MQPILITIYNEWYQMTVTVLEDDFLSDCTPQITGSIVSPNKNALTMASIAAD